MRVVSGGLGCIVAPTYVCVNLGCSRKVGEPFGVSIGPARLVGLIRILGGQESRICQRATGSKAVEFQSRVKRVQRVQGAAICI